MQEKIELNRVRNLNEIIEDSIQFYKQNWKPLLRSYFVICGFFCLTGLVVGLLNAKATLNHIANSESPYGITYFLAIGYETLNYLMISLTVYCFMALYKEKGNEAPTVEEVWSYVKYFFFRIFGSWICLGALIAAGTLCCVLPGIYFAVVLSLTFPVIIMENSTLGYAFNRSFQLIKNNWWITFLIIIISWIIIFAAMFSIIIPVMLITLAVNLLQLANVIGVYTYAGVIITHLLQFVYMLPLIAVALNYYSFTEAKDEGTLYQRILMIGKTSNDNIEPLTEEY